MAAEPGTVGVLDLMVARVLGSYPFDFTLPAAPADREVAYRLRFEAVVAAGWADPATFPDGLERDGYDDGAVQVIGWLADEPVCTGRLVLPARGHRLPTEHLCELVVAPRGEVVEVGRMSVARNYQSHQHAAFIALLCRLYLDMRERGFDVACGMMAAPVRRLLARLGLQLQQLGADREYWGQLRAPVRFALTAEAQSLFSQWPVPEVGPGPSVAHPEVRRAPG